MIIIDLPDPNNPSLARLYSKEFYKLVKLHLTPQGFFVTQATSPFFAREAFWTIVSTVNAANFNTVIPYHINVPSFGEWGFVLGTNVSVNVTDFSLSVDTKYLDHNTFNSMLTFEKDIAFLNMTPSSIDKPNVLERYLRGWEYYN